MWRRTPGAMKWAAAMCLALAVALAVSCSSVNRNAAIAPVISGAAYVGNQVCYDCHTNITRAFPSSPHARLHALDARMEGTSGCESCHGPGSLHVNAGGGRGVFIVNPGKDADACFHCHMEVHAEFKLPRHHPVIEGRMNCVECHDPHGLDIFKPAGGLAMARVNESCSECHIEQARPFVFEHEALREGCIVCHQAHGSINDKMLVERDNNLCLKCHAQIAMTTPGPLTIGQFNHSPRVLQGGCWSAGCHTAVHGSNVDPRLRY